MISYEKKKDISMPKICFFDSILAENDAIDHKTIDHV